MAGNKSEKNAPKNQEMQEITILGELCKGSSNYSPSYYSWKQVDKKEKEVDKKEKEIPVSVRWKGPILELLEKDSLKNIVGVSTLNPKIKFIKFNFKVENELLAYAIYNCSSENWQEGHILKILDVDNYMIRVADKMKKIIDLVGKVDTLIRIVDYDRYKLYGNVSQLVESVDSLIIAKNEELANARGEGIIPRLISHNGNSYEQIDNRADLVISFLKSEKYKECTTNKNVGVYKRVKRSVKKVFNKITGRENIDKLYKDIEADVDKLKECSFIDDKIKESLDISKDRNWEYFATINMALLKIINKLGEFSNFKLTNVWESRCGRVTTDSKTIKPMLKQYGIIDPDDTLKEAAICRYVLKNLLKSQRDSKSKVDEETSIKVKLKEVRKKYKQVIDKFSGDIGENTDSKVVKLSCGKCVPNNTESLQKNCEKLAQHYRLEGDLSFYSSYSQAQALNDELNQLYGKISAGNYELASIRTDSKRIAYCDKVLTELLKDDYKPQTKADEDDIGEYSVSDTVTNKLEGWFNKSQGIDNVDRYLDDSKGLISIGASDKDWKKWYGYVKGKIKDLNVVIKEYSLKISLDNSYWEEAKFISMLYILSRSVEHADKNQKETLAEYLQELGANMHLNGKYIPGSIKKDSAAVKKAAYKLYKACTDSIKDHSNSIKALCSGFTMNKKQCIKILDCISSTDRGTDIDADTMKNLRILEKKIKSKLKAN